MDTLDTFFNINPIIVVVRQELNIVECRFRSFHNHGNQQTEYECYDTSDSVTQHYAQKRKLIGIPLLIDDLFYLAVASAHLTHHLFRFIHHFLRHGILEININVIEQQVDEECL